MSSNVPFRARHLDHVVLRARQTDTLIRFYRDVLGCQVERQVPAVALTQLRAGDALIDIIAAPAEDPPGRNQDHFCLRVDPFEPERIIDHLTRHGFAPSEVRRVYGAEGFGPSIYVDDPEGNTVELKGPAEERKPGRG